MSSVLGVFGIDWHLLLAQGVNFIVLAALLTWLLYKPVMKIVREREAVIAQGVDDAEKAKALLTDADSEVKTRLSGAETEAEAIVASAREDATSEKARIVAEANARAAASIADAEARAKEAQAKALRESEKEIARLSILAAEKVLKQK